MGGFKNPNSASVSWAGVKKKIMSGDGSSDTPVTVKAAPKIGKIRVPKIRTPVGLRSSFYSSRTVP